MNEASSRLRSRWRIFIVLWLLAMPGMAALAWSIIPQWLKQHALPLDHAYPAQLLLLWLALLLALAVGLGVLLAPRVGLSAPVVTAWAFRRSPRQALKRVWLPGLAGGVAGAAWLFTIAVLWPASLKAADPLYTMPLLPKLLYGGVTGEVLVRWGMLSCVFWGVWRLADKPQATTRVMGWTAVVLCALIWAFSHWLIASWLLGPLSGLQVLHVMLGRMVYGLLAGFLCWRHGLEAALIAHVLTYFLSHGLSGPIL